MENKKEIKCELIAWQQNAKRKREEAARARREKRQEIVATILGILVFVAIFLLMGIVGDFEFEEAKAEVKPTTKVTTEKVTTEPTTETTTEVKTFKAECLITDVVDDLVTVEYNGNLYNFYGNGFAKGTIAICTFTKGKMEIIDAEQKQKFFDVPLSKDLQLHIFKECEKYNIAPAFIIAMIERESNYNAKAIGDNGNSLGLMQIQPKWYAEKMSELNATDLLNPYDNITVGISIVADLFAKYNDNVYGLLHEYNGGLAYARRMESKGLKSDYALTIVERSFQLETELYGK